MSVALLALRFSLAASVRRSRPLLRNCQVVRFSSHSDDKTSPGIQQTNADRILNEVQKADETDEQRRLREITDYYSQFLEEYQQTSEELAAAEAEVDAASARDHSPLTALPISLERGESGVFDLLDLVTLLRHIRGFDIAVIRLPQNLGYATYMILVSVLSARHLRALRETVYKVYKARRNAEDPIPLVEGKGRSKREANKEWQAIDMGNIVLHIMLPKVREHYDIESLWALGPEYDELTHVKEEIDAWQAMMAEHSVTATGSLETAMQQLKDKLQKAKTAT